MENLRVRNPRQFTIAFKRQDNVALITIDDAPVTQLPVSPEGKSGWVLSGGAATFTPTAQ